MGTCQLINKKDSSDKEMPSEDQYESGEDISTTPEDQYSDDQDKYDTALDEDKACRDGSY